MNIQVEKTQVPKIELTGITLPKLDLGSIAAISFFVLYIAAGMYAAVS